MSIQTSVTLGVQVPNFGASWTLTADAYDRAAVTIPKGQAAGNPGTTLELQPGKATEVLLLVIKCSDYSGNVTYSFGGPSWALTTPQVISGTGLVGAVTHGPPATPNQIIFDTSKAAADVTVDVLVLRTAMA